MDTEYFLDFWSIVSEYIPSKDRQVAADHVINQMVDAGASDELLEGLASIDEYMQNAVKEYLVEEESEEIETSDDY